MTPLRRDSRGGAVTSAGRIASHAFVILRKDLVLEWRSRSRSVSVLLFGLVTLLLFSFAVGPDSKALAAGAAGFLVLAQLLSSTLALSESFRVENEDLGLEGLLLLPAEPVAIYYGKTLANSIVLIALGPFLISLAIVLYSLTVSLGDWWTLLGLWSLAAVGLSAPGTLYSAMTSRIRSQDVLLPLLLYPLVVPVLMSAVKAFDLAMHGDAMNQLGSWTLLLGAFAVVYWLLGGILCSHVIEDS